MSTEGVRGAAPGRPGAAAPVTRGAAGAGSDAGDAFAAALERSRVTFSGHAQKRMEQRGLDLGPERMARLERAMDRAEAKGSRDSLILLDELALVVSIRNHTVVTAIDQGAGREQVFTNIDSVVIAE